MIAALLAQPCVISETDGLYVVEPLRFVPIRQIAVGDDEPPFHEETNNAAAE
ncbi:hypothetical protein [Tardibacter chloracetimidivorans]|uniref:hypothetical protein n=1 Tax=Tardibacter chloracetimidivorans TaxID=1921510 RepID=UPI0013019A17|nr:hypothetical protein [Tardibacter chloracetimidivorans]